MATDLENLLTRRSNILSTLAGLTSKASYSIDGQSVDHNVYRKSLLEELSLINGMIEALEGPVEIITEGYV